MGIPTTTKQDKENPNLKDQGSERKVAGGGGRQRERDRVVKWDFVGDSLSPAV
jgi:hypothetical protein